MSFFSGFTVEQIYLVRRLNPQNSVNCHCILQRASRLFPLNTIMTFLSGSVFRLYVTSIHSTRVCKQVNIYLYLTSNDLPLLVTKGPNQSTSTAEKLYQPCCILQAVSDTRSDYNSISPGANVSVEVTSSRFRLFRESVSCIFSFSQLLEQFSLSPTLLQ